MKKKTKSILAIVLAVLLLLTIIVTLSTTILFSKSDTPKIFGHYIYLMESDTMEASASGTSVATDLTAVATDGATVDSESASASIHKNTAVIASVYSESDPIAKYNAVLCVLAPDDPSTDVDSDRIAVRRINTIAQDESGILKYYPTTMQADTVGTEPPITVDNILGKCTYESKELYSYVKFVNSVPGILLLMVLPAVILVIMLIVAIVRANTKSDDDFAFEENYDEVFSEDSYDPDADYSEEELGARSPLFHPEDASSSRSFEQRRSSIAQNFERKAVNPNSPYQKARTMQFKAQHDVPIYTNPEDQIPVGGTAPDAGRYENPGFDEDATSIFHTRSEYAAADSTVPPVSAPIAPDSSAAYHGSHEASSPEEARNLGETRPLYSNPASAAYTPQHAAPAQPAAPASAPAPAPAPKPAAPQRPASKYDSASIDELLAMIEDEKKKLDD